MTADIDIAPANMLQGSNVVRKLAARKKIQELEESTSTDEHGNEKEEPKDGVRDAITSLGMENGLASKYTSFVGVDKQTGKALEDKPMSTRDIKNQVPSGFGITFGGGRYITNSLGACMSASAPMTMGPSVKRSMVTKCKKSRSGKFSRMQFMTKVKRNYHPKLQGPIFTYPIFISSFSNFQCSQIFPGQVVVS